MHRVKRTVEAPADFAVGLVGVPEGTGIELDLRLEAVVEGVLVSGTACAPFTGECSRCLDELASQVDVEFQELFVYPDEEPDTGDPAAEDEENSRLEGDLLDMEPVIRDAVVLALPASVLCSDDCPGLCPDCGARLASVGPEHRHDENVDPRWTALQGLKDSMNDTQEG